MVISDSNPIQWFLIGQPTFNEKIEDGVDHIDFFQPWNNSDTIKDQLNSVPGINYVVKAYDVDDVLLGTFPYEEIIPGVYWLEIIPEDEGLSDKFVRFERVALIVSETSEWDLQASAANNSWTDIAFGNGIFVAISDTGSGNRVMTSPDGINWTIRASAADNQWKSIAFGNDIFVAVAFTGSGNRVMTSPDGINWTIRVSAADNQWASVTFGNNLFVAVALSGSGNRVMTSVDGITWTSRASAADNLWAAVTYGDGLYVAIASSGSGNRVMTSPDGITWTSRVSAADNNWGEVSYGNGIFVALAQSGVGDRLMTSVDGITWVSQPAAVSDSDWDGLVFGSGLFVAVSQNGDVISSTDGIVWAVGSGTGIAAKTWRAVTYGDDLFVAVASAEGIGSGNRVMTATAVVEEEVEALSDCMDIKEYHPDSRLILYSNKHDYDNLIYSELPFVPNFSIRVVCKFYNPRSPEENESERLSTGKVVKLLGTIVKQKQLEVDPVPPYYNLKIKNALQHNTVYINNEKWVKEGEYKDDEVIDKSYPFFKGEAYLTKQDDSYTANPFGE